LCDFAPTFLEAGGVPKGKGMTGNSLLPLLRSEKSGQVELSRTHVLTGNERHCFLYPSRALRNKEFLYIRNFNPGRWDAGAIGEGSAQSSVCESSKIQDGCGKTP
ncbi:hypothetical protein OAL23_01050, partial [bacterium]|nr:hypothetical protein [bacterium]